MRSIQRIRFQVCFVLPANVCLSAVAHPKTAKITAGHLHRHFRKSKKRERGGRPGTGICHFCRAGQAGLDYEEMPRVLNWSWFLQTNQIDIYLYMKGNLH